MMKMRTVLSMFLLASAAVASDRDGKYGVSIECEYRKLGLKKRVTDVKTVEIHGNFKESSRVYSITPEVTASGASVLPTIPANFAVRSALALKADFSSVISEIGITGKARREVRVFNEKKDQIIRVVKKKFFLGPGMATKETTEYVGSVGPNKDYSFDDLKEMAETYMERVYGVKSLTLNFVDKLPPRQHYGFVPRGKKVRIRVGKNWIKIDGQGKNAPQEKAGSASTFRANRYGCLYLADENHGLKGKKLNYHYLDSPSSLYVSSDWDNKRPRWKWDAKNERVKISYQGRELNDSHHLKEKGMGGNALVQVKNDKGNWEEL